MKKYAPFVLLVLAVLGAAAHIAHSWQGPADTRAASQNSGDTAIGKAYRKHISNIPVQGRGRVARVLPDDRRGESHQRFILRLASGQTLMIAHNIDIARRITHLHRGETVRFKGIYVWNDQGGIVHWTHHDPHGHHTAGWLKASGVTYH
jgi:hypothetical protein